MVRTCLAHPLVLDDLGGVQPTGLPLRATADIPVPCQRRDSKRPLLAFVLALMWGPCCAVVLWCRCEP